MDLVAKKKNKTKVKKSNQIEFKKVESVLFNNRIKNKTKAI